MHSTLKRLCTALVLSFCLVLGLGNIKAEARIQARPNPGIDDPATPNNSDPFISNYNFTFGPAEGSRRGIVYDCKNVTASVYTFTSGDDWIHVSITTPETKTRSSHIFWISADRNNSNSSRAGHIEFVADGRTFIVRVSQGGNPNNRIFNVKADLTALDDNMLKVKATVKTNTSFKYRIGYCKKNSNTKIYEDWKTYSVDDLSNFELKNGKNVEVSCLFDGTDVVLMTTKMGIQFLPEFQVTDIYGGNAHNIGGLTLPYNGGGNVDPEPDPEPDPVIPDGFSYKISKISISDSYNPTGSEYSNPESSTQISGYIVGTKKPTIKVTLSNASKDFVILEQYKRNNYEYQEYVRIANNAPAGRGYKSLSSQTVKLDKCFTDKYWEKYQAGVPYARVYYIMATEDFNKISSQKPDQNGDYKVEDFDRYCKTCKIDSVHQIFTLRVVKNNK